MFGLPIDDFTYRKLNKNKAINKYFRSSSVGKCMQLIDDFFRTAQDFNKRAWVNYYYDKMGTARLTEITDAITEQTKIDREIIKRYVFHRVLGQTYNGFVTEIKVLQQMQKEFEGLDFTKTDYLLDEQYFTDFEVYCGNELVFGGQIKPISYLYMSSPYQKKAKENHEKQRQAYSDMFRVPHLIVYYDDGKLHEKDKVFNKINLILSRNIM